ncbi:MAG: hypothetical protein JJW00_02340 [Sulfurimonas sp.]|nr:hypothetical protein [Sulfurimonas sp.]
MQNKTVYIIYGVVFSSLIGYAFIKNSAKKEREAQAKTVAIKKPHEQKTAKLPDMDIAKKYGLTKLRKLKYDTTWNMAWDDKNIYVVTKYKKSSFVEVYDKKSLKPIQYNKIPHSSIHDTISPIGVNDEHLYIGTNGVTKLLDKNSLVFNTKGYINALSDNQNRVDGIRVYKNHIITYGEQNYIRVFQDEKRKYFINQERNYPPNIRKIKDYWDYNRVNDVIVHKDKLYSANYRGFINIYDFKTGKFLKQINTIKFEKEWGYVLAKNIQDIAVYQERYIYFAQDFRGVIILDTQTDKITTIKTLFEKHRGIAKDTEIFQMLFYKDNLIFSEIFYREKCVYVYSLSQKKIIHTFKGHNGDITEMFVDGDRLVGLSDNGYLFEWDLGIF